MYTIIAAILVLCILFTFLLWLFRYAANGRATQLATMAESLQLTYEPWHALSPNIRQAGFQVLCTGEARYVQHWLENDDVAMFDFISVNTATPKVQTLFITPCPLTSEIRLMASRKPWVKTDCFTDQPRRSLVKIANADLPQQLHPWHIAGEPAHRVRRLLNKTVIHWLLTHSHLHIEWAAGMLLVCQPGYLVEATEIEKALADITSLKTALSECEANTAR